jgi:hypothetical protein
MMNRCVYYTIVHIRLLETYSHCEDIAPRATAAWLGTCQWSGFDLQLWSHIGGALWVNFWEQITISVQVISRFFGPYVSIKKTHWGKINFWAVYFLSGNRKLAP